MRATARKRGPERREEIAKAVLRIVGDRGVAALSTTTLAEEVGVTSGALFRHFASRDEMLQAAVQHAVARIESTFPDPSLPPLERALGLARNRVRLLGAEPDLAWLLRSEQAYHMLPAAAVAQLRGLVKRSERCFIDAIREGVVQGTIRDDIDPESLRVLVMGTVHALIGMPGVHRRAKTARRPAPENVLAALERVLAPAGPPKAARSRAKARANKR